MYLGNRFWIVPGIAKLVVTGRVRVRFVVWWATLSTSRTILGLFHALIRERLDFFEFSCVIALRFEVR